MKWVVIPSAVDILIGTKQVEKAAGPLHLAMLLISVDIAEWECLAMNHPDGGGLGEDGWMGGGGER